MIDYFIRRLLLLPLTLFAIILVNFVILNLAPGEPVNGANLGQLGEASRHTGDAGPTGENPYLLFREHYGLTLPILMNTWPSLKTHHIREGITRLLHKEEMSVQAHHDLKTLWGDRARFIMPLLLQEAVASTNSHEARKIAAHLFIRGGTRQGHVGIRLTEEEKRENRKIGETNLLLNQLHIHEKDSVEEMERKIGELASWFKLEEKEYPFTWSRAEKIELFFLETRFCKYLKRVFLLNFGTVRNDNNKTVISEVVKRIKYSLTLAVIPMVITFALCQFFGMIMAFYQRGLPDYLLNLFFLTLFAIPVFVAAPFLIEKVALRHTLFPYSGFHSPEETYDTLTSLRRMGDIIRHLILPLTAVIYSTLAIQSRISRTAFLEALHQDYVRTARAKGLGWMTILTKHVGRNAAVTIVTSLAASLGVVLGGSLIVETLFDINGFGKFFYEAILNRDYNVVLFSAFAGSLLTLVGYFVADVAYAFLDPRVSYS